MSRSSEIPRGRIGHNPRENLEGQTSWREIRDVPRLSPNSSRPVLMAGSVQDCSECANTVPPADDAKPVDGRMRVGIDGFAPTKSRRRQASGRLVKGVRIGANVRSRRRVAWPCGYAAPRAVGGYPTAAVSVEQARACRHAWWRTRSGPSTPREVPLGKGAP